jgi:putative transposase
MCGPVCHVLNRSVGRATIFPHTTRWHHAHGTLGTGPLYQGRFKSFPVDTDEHFPTICRYVERNALRANLVERAEDWRWSGLWHRRHPSHRGGLSAWPVAPPSNWVDHVNEPQTEAEMQALRQSLRKGLPFGSEAWQQATADQFGVDLAPRRPGRPRCSPSTPDC